MPATLERTASMAEFKARLSEYAEAIANGESVVVTRYNKPVFRATPVETEGSVPRCKGALAKYADPAKIAGEESAWRKDVMRRAADFA